MIDDGFGVEHTHYILHLGLLSEIVYIEVYLPFCLGLFDQVLTPNME
jgi:hypothetical protein